MRRLILLAILVPVCVAPAAAQSTWDAPTPDPVPYQRDSGFLFNAQPQVERLYDERVHFERGAWIRLYFGDTVLGEGSYLQITSTLDGETQKLDAAALQQWGNTSAYFNGDTLKVELFAGASTQNRVVIDQAAWDILPDEELGDGCAPGCCGADDRVLSDEDFASRLMPAGCSATTYNTDSCAVSAGHCISGGMVLQFRVPISNPNCSLNHPPVSEQFPVTGQSFTNAGPGNDWAVMTTGTNNLGQTAFERYGVFRPIADNSPTVGDLATVWGYGQDNQCTHNHAQQTSGGDITNVTSTLIRYAIDVTFGNSGSSVIRDADDEILGIVTHCCCPNQGTNIEHPNFTAAREALCPTSALQTIANGSFDIQLGTQVAGDLNSLRESDGIHLEIDSVSHSIRNSTMTVVTSVSPFPTVNELELRVEYGPANASPVFRWIQILNDDTGVFETLGFGIVSTTGDTVQTFEISNPNSYVNSAGEIQTRVIQTARQVQTDPGYTTLIDQVQVQVAP
jgi:hypothetical protein